MKEISDTAQGQSLNNTVHGENPPAQRSGSGSGAGGGGGANGARRSTGSGDKERREMVLKVTSILSRQQRDIAEKEAKLLSRLSHPSIIKMYDTCYRTVSNSSGGGAFRKGDEAKKERPQHLILMEFCEGGHALDVCNRMAARGERFDLSTLIIAFGQICNAVSYLHAQRPPIVHRDLKPANFLVKNGAYKLCDFGSAVFGHVDLKTAQARAEAEEVIQKTTTQMFRAPEMVDLYSVKKLTQATDVWALGACLYSLAFLQNCFEEGSNLAILSRKYKIPDDNPYGDGLVELIDRMLTLNMKERADMTEVILCLSAVYSGRALPPRKERKKSTEKEATKESSTKEAKEGSKHSKKKSSDRAGTFRTGNTYEEDLTLPKDAVFAKPVRDIDPNSALARRRQAAQRGSAAAPGAGGDSSNFAATFDNKFDSGDNPFASGFSDGGAADGEEAQAVADGSDIFGSFDGDAAAALDVFGKGQEWGNSSSGGKFDDFASFSPEAGEAQMTHGNAQRRLDEDLDEDDDIDDNEGENNNEEEPDKPRRRKSASRRIRANSGSNIQVDADEVAEKERDADASERKRAPRRTRSSSRRQARSSKDSDELAEMANSMDDMNLDEDNDDDDQGEEPKSKGPRPATRRSQRGSAKAVARSSRRTLDKEKEPSSKPSRSGSRDGMLQRSSSRRAKGDEKDGGDEEED